MKNIVNRALVAKKKQFQSKSVPRGARTIWRYLGALFLLFTFAIGNVWGATETVNKTKDNWTGTSCTLTHAECANGSADSKKDGDASNVTYIKFRTNKNSNTMTFNVVEGYKVTGFYLRAYTNDDSTPAELTSIQYDADDAIVLNATIPTSASKTEGTTYTYNNTTSEATSSIVLQFNNSGKQIMAVITITYEEIPSGPVDPTITFNNGAYTVGDAALDLSSLFSSNSAGAVTYSVKTDGETNASIDGTNFTATAAGTCVVTASQAAETGKYNAKDVDANIVVSPAETPACPAGLSISGTAAYTEGETISLTAALEAGNGGITYTWYKGSIAAGNEVGTGDSFSKANCVAGDAGDYFCVASKDACASAESAAYAVTVAAVTACYTFTPTLPAEAVTFVVNDIVPGSTGGSIKVLGNTMKNTAYGLSFESNSSAKVEVTLGSLMKEGTQISVTVLADYKDNNNRGLLLQNGSGTKKADWLWKPAVDAIREAHNFTYTVQEGDGMVGTNVFRIARSTNAIITSLTVSNCGADLLELSSAIEPVHDPAYATVTLSKTLLAAGGTATATYSAIDPAYDFDEWQISGTGATLSSTTANPTTITMGSTDAVVTLKLKEKAGFAVTYKANNGTEEADVVVSKESTFAANTFTAPEGKMFAGWNTQADGKGTNYAVGAAVEAATTVYAKWVVDPTIRLIKNDGTLNTVNFVTGGTLKDDGPFTVEAVEYAKNVQFGNSCSGVSSIDNLNKAVIYHSTTNATKVTIVAYNNYTGGSTANLLYAVVPEGTTTASAITKTLNKSTGGVYEVNMTGRSTLYIYAGHKEVRICQVSVEENGTANAVAPAVGYSVNLNKQRPFLTSGAVTEFEGIEYKVSSNYKPLNGQVQIQTLETNYISFEIPEGETRQLQLTTSNTNKYTVSKTLGDNTESQKVSGNQNINLTAGTWYINPQGSNVNITNITFAAAPDPLTVTFKDGESTLGEQALFVGDKVAEPEAPTKTGYRFDKWQRSGADYDFDYTLVAGDAPGFTLDAVWQKTWKVTFDADNGSDPVVVTVDNNQAVAQPVNPEKAGFDFVEWQLSGSAYNFATLVTGDITLTATWEVAQDDASLSALSYNGNAIDVASAEDVNGVQTYTYHLPWGSTIDPALVSVTKNAETATVGSITYDSENNRISFAVESGNHTVTINYAIQFVIDAKRGTSIVKATTNNVVTGLIGGTIDQSYSGNANSRKLNKTNYFGVTLANDETFQEGDVFIVNITTAADLGKFMVFADKDRTELIADQGIVYTKPDVASPVVCPTGEMMLVLPAAANGKKSLYLSRENVDNSEQWNVTFSYIEVTRERNPAIKSFKFGDDAATINESAKTISIDVPYGTAVTALTPTVEAYGNNGATYTPSGATDFTSPVVYTVTDAYNELHTDYTVTVNIAAPSTNAYLASLSVAGYALDFDKEVETYNIVLDYGTTVLPEITYAVEDAGLATAVKVEGGVNGATTITVTPQAGESYKKVYTINFSVSTTPKFVIYDGQKSAPMAEIATSGSDVSTGFAWTITGASNTNASNAELSFEGKTYSKYVNLFTSATKAPNAGNTRYITITVPDGYVAKFRVVGCGNGNGSRSSFISKEITGTLDQSIVYATTTANNVLDGRTSALQLPGTYYYCADNSIRLYELSVQLYPIDEARAMTQGRFGTICYPNGGRLLGAMLLEIAYFDPDQKKIFFDEVIGGQMVAGAPYLFLPNEGVDKFAIVYTDNVDAPAGHHNGLYGSYTQEALPTDGNHYIMLNNQYCKVVEANTYVGANRAYIQLDKIGNDYVAPAYGRRRVSLGVQQAEVATGLEDLNVGDQPIKIMINGQMYILRGEKMYDATGRLVK